MQHLRFQRKFQEQIECISKIPLHPEKCFVESTKIWLAKQNFSFKYGPMVILFELTKKLLLTFFAIATKEFCIVCKKMELQIKITKLL